MTGKPYQVRLRGQTLSANEIYRRGGLRAVREARGLQIKHVAAQAQISATALGRAERGNAGLSVESLARVAAVLGITLVSEALAPLCADISPRPPRPRLPAPLVLAVHAEVAAAFRPGEEFVWSQVICGRLAQQSAVYAELTPRKLAQILKADGVRTRQRTMRDTDGRCKNRYGVALADLRTAARP